MSVISVDFEVVGKVQGCNFTKHAKDLAESLGVCGWIKNSRSGSIVGRAQGTKETVDAMVKWLKEEGSPGCEIQGCELSECKGIVRPDYGRFTLKF